MIEVPWIRALWSVIPIKPSRYRFGLMSFHPFTPTSSGSYLFVLWFRKSNDWSWLRFLLVLFLTSCGTFEKDVNSDWPRCVLQWRDWDWTMNGSVAAPPVNIVRGTTGELVAFLVLNMWPSHFGLPVMLFIVLFSKRVKRHAIFVNLLVAFIITGVWVI